VDDLNIAAVLLFHFLRYTFLLLLILFKKRKWYQILKKNMDITAQVASVWIRKLKYMDITAGESPWVNCVAAITSTEVIETIELSTSNTIFL
jgi:hypothetical protein